MCWDLALLCKDSVKIGYHVAKSEGESGVVLGPSSSLQIPSQLWQCIWNLQLPPKIKHFIWRMLNDAIATKEALKKKRCAQDDLCPICGNEVETIEHLILMCPWANRCWFGCSLSLLVQKDQVVSIKKWCEDVFLKNSELTEEDKALIAAICWGIWTGRCSWVFNSDKLDSEKVISVATLLVKEVWSAKAVSNVGMCRKRGEKVERKLKWIAPDADTVKINVDGDFNRQT